MFRKVFLIALLLLTSCGNQPKPVVEPTVAPLTSLKEDIRIPELRVNYRPEVSPSRYIRVYRCSYRDDFGNVRKGEFIYVKLKDEEVRASF